MGIEKPETDRARWTARELQLEVSSKQRTLYFHGESMRPFLVEGDEVVVEPVGWDTIRPGDIITYRCLDRFPTRRVIRKTGRSLLLWCENWPDREFHADREEVLGRAVARRRGDAWLAATDRAWKVARISAIVLYWRLYAHYVALPAALRRARRALKLLIRVVGLDRKSVV